MNNILAQNSYQKELWLGKFGDEYIDRNRNFDSINKLYIKDTGQSFERIFRDFFHRIPRQNSIIEIGCNVGLNLKILEQMGFTDLTGIEINKKAYEIAKKDNPNMKFINSSIEEFSPSNKFDLVFTNGVLMHINPNILTQIIKKMIALSKKWIFDFEYFSDTPVQVNYRGHDNSLFKQNFLQLFLDELPSLKIVMQKKVYYKQGDLVDIFYLLRKSFNNEVKHG